MDSTEILSLLEKPTRDRRKFVYQIRDEAAVADIVAALRTSTKPHIRSLLCYILNLQAGAELFEGTVSETKQAVPALIKALADADVRDSAIDALGHIGDPASGPALLREYLRENDDVGLRASLASAMGCCHYAPAIPILIEALSSPNDLLRRQAVQGLRHLQAQEAREPLQKVLMIQTLTDPESHVRAAAAQALGQGGDKRSIEPLLAAIQDSDVDVRRAVVTALSVSKDERALEPLLNAFLDRR